MIDGNDEQKIYLTAYRAVVDALRDEMPRILGGAAAGEQSGTPAKTLCDRVLRCVANPTRSLTGVYGAQRELLEGGAVPYSRILRLSHVKAAELRPILAYLVAIGSIRQLRDEELNEIVEGYTDPCFVVGGVPWDVAPYGTRGLQN